MVRFDVTVGTKMGLTVLVLKSLTVQLAKVHPALGTAATGAELPPEATVWGVVPARFPFVPATKVTEQIWG